MQVGSLGNIVFTVSDDTVKTISNFVWSGSARYSTHQRHLTNALTEFTGIDPDSITVDVVVSAYLGVNPMTEIKRIVEYEQSGTVLPLTVGTQSYGRYRWVISGHKTKIQTYDGRGNVTSATISLTLQEYLKG